MSHTKGPWTAIYTPSMNLPGIHIRPRAAPDLLKALMELSEAAAGNANLETLTRALDQAADAVQKAWGQK